MIRYKIEESIINGLIDLKDLPTIWAKYMKEYLNLDINNDTEGVLQDVHWSYGYIGYFPTYALGSAYAAQFFNKLSKDIDVDKALLNNNFKEISKWLENNIHRHAGLYNSYELLKKVTNEEFNPNYYIDYLINKYSEIYK